MFIGKTTQLLTGTNTNISPAVGIESIYYELVKSDADGQNASVFKLNIAKHMAIQMHVDPNTKSSFNVIADTNALIKDNFIYGISTSTALFSGNKNTYEYINNNELSNILQNILIDNATDNDIIAIKTVEKTIKSNTKYGSESQTYMGVDLLSKKYNLTDLLHHYSTHSTINEYSVWIEKRAEEKANDACIYVNNIRRQQNINNKISDISTKTKNISTHINNASIAITTAINTYNSMISVQDNDIAAYELYNGEPKTLNYKYIVKYEPEILHGSIIPGNAYSNHGFDMMAIGLDSIDLPLTKFKIIGSSDPYYKDQNLSDWEIKFDQNYFSSIKVNDDYYYRLENVDDIIKYYTIAYKTISAISPIYPQTTSPNGVFENELKYNNILGDQDIWIFSKQNGFDDSGNISYAPILKDNFIIYNNGVDKIYSYGTINNVVLKSNHFYYVAASKFEYTENSTGSKKMGCSITLPGLMSLDEVQCNPNLVAHGKIVYMKDEYGNGAPYDFKNKWVSNKNTYTFCPITTKPSGNTLFKMSFSFPSLLDMLDSSYIKEFVDNYVNKTSQNIIDLSTYISIYSYIYMHEEEIDGDVLSYQNLFIDFIFDYSNDAEDIKNLYKAALSSNIILINGTLLELDQFENYNLVSFYWDQPDVADIILNNMTNLFFNCSSTNFIESLPIHQDATTDIFGISDNIYTYTLPLAKYISRGCAGLGDLDYEAEHVGGVLSCGWLNNLKEWTMGYNFGILSPLIISPEIVYPTYDDISPVVEKGDYSITGSCIGNIIKNDSTIIGGPAKYNYIGIDCANISIINTSTNVMENINIKHNNDDINIVNSDNITIGSYNLNININNSYIIDILNDNKDVNIVNSDNIHIHNLCESINIGSKLVHSENIIVHSKCYKNNVIGTNNTIYSLNNNIKLNDAHMVTIGPATSSSVGVLNYHNNHEYHTNQIVSTSENILSNNILIDKLKIVNLFGSSTFDCEHYYDATLNTWVIPSNLNGHEYNIEVDLNTEAGVFNFYELDSSLSVVSTSTSSFTLGVNTTEEKTYTNWFEYDAERKLLANLNLITYNGDISKNIYISNTSLSDMGIKQFVYILDVSTTISTQGTFYINAIDSSRYIKIANILNSSLNFEIIGYMASEIKGFKLLDTHDGDNYITGSIDKKTLDTLSFASGGYITPEFNRVSQSKYSVCLKYSFGSGLQYRSWTTSGVKHPLKMSFHDKYGKEIAYVLIKIASIDTNIGLSLLYYSMSGNGHSITTGVIRKTLSADKFQGIVNIDSSLFLYWADSINTGYYIKFSDDVLVDLSNGLPVNKKYYSFDNAHAYYGTTLLNRSYGLDSTTSLYHLNLDGLPGNPHGYILFRINDTISINDHVVNDTIDSNAGQESLDIDPNI